ncbi:MAG: acyltransferase [Rikenellaceae bacterium]
MNIWSISSEAEFEAAAMETFRYVSEHCSIYKRYLELIECNPLHVEHSSEIPHLPISLFKSHLIYSHSAPPEAIFTSSNTGSTIASRHAMASLEIYERAFTKGFELFYGATEGWSIYALLPSYLEREGSSLIYMADKLIAKCGSGGFYLNNYEQLIADMAADPKPKILLGVSYALWDLAEIHAPKLENTIVMETGGMKGRREEIAKSELHKILCRGFGVEKIHSEYGMAELTSQGYSQGENIFRTPPWMRVSTRDLNDPMERLAAGRRGGINITDLASRYSMPFIQSEDMGVLLADGSFTIDGRISRSDIRGCNLLVDGYER